MKLLFTLTAYPPYIGGAQLLQHQLAQQLQKQHQIQVVSHWNQNRTDWLLGTTLNAPDFAEDYIVDGIPVHRLGLSWQEKLRLLPYLPLYYPLMQVALPPIANCLEKQLIPFAHQADLVHNVRIGREGLSYASLQVARRYGIPFVFTPVHHPRWVGWRYQAYIKLYQMADAVIALTEAERNILVDLGVQPNRITVTGMGPVLAEQADPVAFWQKYQIESPIVLFLGQHYLYKGYRQLLQAAKLVWQKVPAAQFVFIGPAVKQSEQDFAAMPDPRIHRLGKVDLQTKTNAIAAANLLCVPSTQESFGGVYVEAWNFSKPVIGCNIPAVAELISDGVDGYLVEQNPGQIADRICHLLLNPTQAEAMGQAGQHKVEARYTCEKLARITEQAYQRVLA
ncbi:MAG: glycosyltransferase family 4 protein [Aphanocapsa sp. GSE-SYN-MK-11-07L]|jgi:glycosyltransferase involved in cell wall biosynthesis|nr:glycosyltransferase family 4 protein [Aphanocapsa sp. GSE-SYN-MK-11-07L]